MNDQQLLRYSRHILLDEIGIEGQRRLLDARVLIIGRGSPGARFIATTKNSGYIALHTVPWRK